MDDERKKDLNYKRAKLEKKPRYGTVSTKHFTPGEKGLNDEEPARWTQGDILPPRDAVKQQFVALLASQSEPNSPEKADRSAMPVSSRTP